MVVTYFCWQLVMKLAVNILNHLVSWPCNGNIYLHYHQKSLKYIFPQARWCRHLFFFEHKEHSLIEFKEPRMNINAKLYNQNMNKPRQGIKWKRPEMISSCVILLCGKRHYSIDFHIFGALEKEFWVGCRIQSSVKGFLDQQPQEFYEQGAHIPEILG